MNQIFCDAIKNRNILEFTYKGHYRVVEPHAYGLSLRGNEMLRCFQVGGTSHSGKVPCWRPILVSQITSLVVTEKHFEDVRDGYKKGDRGMSKIFCELQPPHNRMDSLIHHK